MAPEDREHETDWAAQVVGHLEAGVGRLRDLSVRPAVGIFRILVMATVGSIVGVGILVAVGIGLVRLFDVAVFAGRVWATDFLFGGVLMLTGVMVMRLGARRKEVPHG